MAVLTWQTRSNALVERVEAVSSVISDVTAAGWVHPTTCRADVEEPAATTWVVAL